MGFLIFLALADAEAYTKDIERIEGIPRPGTVRWGDPIKNATQDLWAVIMPTGYEVPVPSTAVDMMDELPKSWWGEQ
jgi:hypothetical protein